MGNEVLWNAVRAAYPARVRALEAVPKKYQHGVLATLIALERGVALLDPEILAALSKFGVQLESKFGTVRNIADARRLVLQALERHATDLGALAAALEGADPGFAKLSRARLSDVMAAYAPGRPGRGSQGLYLSAGRLSSACRAFGDTHEKDAQREFEKARRSKTRVRPAAKRKPKAAPRARSK